MRRVRAIHRGTRRRGRPTATAKPTATPPLDRTHQQCHEYPRRQKATPGVWMRGIRVVSLLVMTLAASRLPAVAAQHQPTPPHGPTMAQVSVCFVPAQECDTSVAEAIAGARQFIRVQAYGFTSPAILGALADARKRGVDVQAILDKTEERDHGSRPAGAQFTAEAGIPTWIDD